MRKLQFLCVKLGFLATIASIATITLYALQEQNDLNYSAPGAKDFWYEDDFNWTASENGNWRQLDKKQIQSLSKLGRILYLEEPHPKIQSLKNYTILVWKYGPSINDRHVKRYTNVEHNPFEQCSATNCKLSYTMDPSKADIVLIHLHRTTGLTDLPDRNSRRKEQIWAFLTDESPHNTFLVKQNLSSYNGLFNWSMTYRMDSDIPVPYGRSILLPKPDNTFDYYSWVLSKKQDVLIAILGSNCGSRNRRWEYVKELQKHIPVDIYGKCGTLKCEGHFRKDCPDVANYMFYLAFENSNCDEYITEKLWWNTYAKSSIPIVMGATKDSYQKLTPPGSYIDVDDFAAPRDLAAYIHYVVKQPEKMEKYFTWKKHFKVVNEHGYFQTTSRHYCRVCEALNYNDRKEKVYKNLEDFWSVKKDCHSSWDKLED